MQTDEGRGGMGTLSLENEKLLDTLIYILLFRTAWLLDHKAKLLQYMKSQTPLLRTTITIVMQSKAIVLLNGEQFFQKSNHSQPKPTKCFLLWCVKPSIVWGLFSAQYYSSLILPTEQMQHQSNIFLQKDIFS